MATVQTNINKARNHLNLNYSGPQVGLVANKIFGKIVSR